MDTTSATDLLVKSLIDLCNDFNQKSFKPLLEADVTAYLYHRLLLNGCPLVFLYSETRVCGVREENRKFDIVIGDVEIPSGCVKPVLIAQVKCFPRRGKTDQQLKHSFEEIIGNDLASLEEASKILPVGRFEIVTDFVFKGRTIGYLNGIWSKSKRVNVLAESCKEIGVSLLWTRPNDKDCLELDKVV